MRAGVLNAGKIHVRDDVPDPVPGPGEVLVEVAACGICGSDLHFAQHGAEMLALGTQIEGMARPSRRELDLDQDVYMGHEFAGRVLEAGPDTTAPPAGTLVTAFPILPRADGDIDTIVYSNTIHGGYGEKLLLAAPLLLEVPNGLPAHHAALTEPMAVGLHAVVRSGIEAGQRAVVVGCGPVGLAVITALRVRGVESIVAADFSTARRTLAATMGATEVVDPRQETVWDRTGAATPLVVFEAVGVPGVLDDIMRCAPARSRVVVVGVCMGADTVHPYFGISKELSVDFVLGYTPEEFAASLRSIAEGEIDVAPLVTARVGLDRLSWAFDALGDPEEHCKIVVEP
ncbi:zinc-binding dehydrogenase [Pseudonocardia halophobica]|uniref:zinc-binding dehydrogenase n=1 Tax=Pseudonocardia halophobica TaxID=29401 RepID=UPI003D93AA87